MDTWEKKLSDFWEEMSPVAKSVMDTGIRELGDLERQGYFRFGSDLLEALRRLVENYEPGSLPALADSLGDVFQVMRLLAHPKVLAAAQDISEGIIESDSQPVEMLGAARRVETERDIQRGIGFALDVLGALGRSVSRAPRLKRRAKGATLARSRPNSNDTSRTPVAVEKVEKGSETFLDDSEWSREWAVHKARSLGFESLSDEMWRIIEFSRRDYRETKKAPNLRRITKALNISTREIYALFPDAPGPTISKIAGVPKPAGCL